MKYPNAKCIRQKETDKYGTDKEIAKAVHCFLDWLRACEARKDDRKVNIIKVLEGIQAGYKLTESFPTHYMGD